MKKIGFLIFFILLCTFISISISAATVTIQTNTSESTAATLNMGDTAVVGTDFGLSYSRKFKYYTVNIESTGTLTLNTNVVSTVYTDYPVGYTFSVYNSNYSTNEYYYYYSTDNSKNIKRSFDITLSPGIYYIAIGDKYFYTHGYADITNYITSNQTLYLTPSFKCSHISTNTTTTKEPTCSETGLKVIKCSECKKITQSITLNKLPHTDGTEWTTLTEPTCTQKGERVLYCTVCNEISKREDIEKLPHTYSDWATDRETTCSQAGLRSRACSVCQTKDEEEIKILDHVYSGWETTKNATCYQEGEKVRTCSSCSYADKAVIEMLSHQFGDWQTEKEASESSYGTNFRICAVCEYMEEKIIPKLVHGEKFEWVTEKEVTCTQNGRLEKICLYCDRVIDSKTVMAEGHDLTGWILIKEPTQYSNGLEVRNCKNCNYEEERKVTLTHGDYGTWAITKEATCNEAGQRAFTCYCCNKVTDTETVPRLNHKFGQWQESIRALPERSGTSIRTCSLCGKNEERDENYSFLTLKTKTKIVPNFKDVASNAWYKDVVANCYHYSLMLGNSETTFNPTGNITAAEVITAAVRIYCLNNSYATKPEMNTSPWYQGYVDYAISKKIIKSDDFSDYTVPATRAEMAYILKNCVSSSKLRKINTIASLPDVTREDKYGEEIFKLYEAGILGGSDEKGTFYPDRSITRAEGAAIIARLSEISDRIKK